MAIGAKLGGSIYLRRQAHKLRVHPLFGADYLDIIAVLELLKVEQKTIYRVLWKSLSQG